MSDEANTLSPSPLTKAVTIDYTNHRGERRMRRILPLSLVWSSNAYHQEMQWLLKAFDEEKQGLRTFAMKNVHSWE